METGGYLRIKQYKYLISTLPKLCMVTVVGAQQTSEHVDPHNNLYQLELLLSPTPRRRPSYKLCTTLSFCNWIYSSTWKKSLMQRLASHFLCTTTRRVSSPADLDIGWRRNLCPGLSRAGLRTGGCRTVWISRYLCRYSPVKTAWLLLSGTRPGPEFLVWRWWRVGTIRHWRGSCSHPSHQSLPSRPPPIVLMQVFFQLKPRRHIS